MATLSLKNISKSYGQTQVLKDISLDIEDGEFVSLVGQSGCGKSTLLRILAGLEAQDSGDVFIGGVPVNDTAPKHRNIAMVFQDYALYPHMSVAENMAMPLIMARLPLHARLPLVRHLAPAHSRHRPGIDRDVAAVAKKLRIDHLLERRPAQLSGGQRQRVALGRALVRDPKIFLMDEPLSNLDAKLRVQVRREITELHASSGLTFVYVTHDQIEAMTMSSRVALMQNGSLLQVDRPNALYANPASIDVARFIGSPEINILAGTSKGGAVHLGGLAMQLSLAPAGGVPSGLVQIGIRPENIVLKDAPELAYPADNGPGISMGFHRHLVEDLGSEVLIHGRLSVQPDLDIRIRAQKSNGYGGGFLSHRQSFEIEINPANILLFDANGSRLSASPTRRMDTLMPAPKLAVEPMTADVS
ncbi:ABC transporter ATP-binding protein [Hoeflea sp.]|uniref:ABC transporter ATP-binding protein n=1 Tax=Hoeflea sp. TaxID=1940281 RepID=UPI0019894EBE|nr:ABC transporter ATP-binding protein [Hoeflea sp.]MBC7282223.1 ABC transporter ATP-binding protein [Hoeflea sp.]